MNVNMDEPVKLINVRKSIDPMALGVFVCIVIFAAGIRHQIDARVDRTLPYNEAALI